MQLGTAHYVPISRLLNHFKILNSLINILWRAQGGDEGCFSPGRVLTHWVPDYRRSWRGSDPSWEDHGLCSSKGRHLAQASTRWAFGSHVVPVSALNGWKPEVMLLVFGHPAHSTIETRTQVFAF